MKKTVVLGVVTMLAFTMVIATAGTDMTKLLADQDIDVGNVSVWNDDENLYVKYETTGDWLINETHLAVDDSLDDIPQTKRHNPIPGQFEYKNESQGPGITVYQYDIPLIWEAGTELFIAAHAEVANLTQNETAWGAGDPFDGKNWATYFKYTIT